MFPTIGKSYKKRLGDYFKNRFGPICEAPIIVLGNQKAGTSAIAHLLADYGGLSKTIDIPPLWQPDVFKIMDGQMEFEHVVKRQRVHFSTDLIKEPNMTFFVEKVMQTFPKANFLFIVRDPRDNIRSHLNRMNIPGHFSQLPESYVSSEMRRILFNASTWGGDEAENYVCALARKWNKATDNYLAYRDRITLVKYEEFLHDKYGVIKKLAVELRVSKKSDISEKLNVQYQPRGDRNSRLEDFFGAKNLVEIEEVCRSRMKELGYSLCRMPQEKR
jgi:hypothetical protein